MDHKKMCGAMVIMILTQARPPMDLFCTGATQNG
jgi:hypothetical protein